MILDIKGAIIAKTATDDIEKVRMSIREGLENSSYGCARISVNPSGDILMSGWLGWLFWRWAEGRIVVDRNHNGDINVSYHLSSILAEISLIMGSLAVFFAFVMRKIGLLLCIALILCGLSIVVFSHYTMKQRLESIIKRQIAKI